MNSAIETRSGGIVARAAPAGSSKRMPVTILHVDGENETPIETDSLDPVSKADREKLVASLPTAFQADARAALNALVYKVIAWRATNATIATSAAATAADEAWPEPVDGAELLDDIVAFLSRFIVLDEAALAAISLWVVHTYVLDAAEFTAYLRITSPTKQCGKTRVLTTLEPIVYRPWLVMGASAAALFRKIHLARPTLLLDEVDSQQGNEEVAEAVRNILNSGFQRNGVTTRCTGEGKAIAVEDFSTFCAKAISGINQLPDTVASRSIEIRIERAPRKLTERLAKPRRRTIEPLAAPLRRRLARWADDNREALGSAEPISPPELGDRQVDIWEPLFSIADTAGALWAGNARLAAISLHGGGKVDEGDRGVMMLSDLRDLFQPSEGQRHAKLATQFILDELAARDDRPWAEHRQSKPITATGVAALLKRFKIKSTTVRPDAGGIFKGYKAADFEAAWEKYLPARSCNGVTPVTPVRGYTEELFP